MRRFILLLYCALGPLGLAGLRAQSIAISPSYTSVGVGGTVQYTASVTGLTNTVVTWSVCGVTGGNATNGTITASGLYTAPAKILANGVTVGALWIGWRHNGHRLRERSADWTRYHGRIAESHPGRFVHGHADGHRVSEIRRRPQWRYQSDNNLCECDNPGSQRLARFDASGGLPSDESGIALGSGAERSVHQWRRHAANHYAHCGFGEAGRYAAVHFSRRHQLSATAGTISASGLYSAPTAMPSSNVITVTATGANGSASATVTLINGNPQTISPNAVSLKLGGTQQFTSSGATTWTTTSGTVTANGFYTAPSTLPSGGSDTVAASGPNGSAKAVVTLIPPTPVITGVGSNGKLPLGIFTDAITGSGFIAQSVQFINNTPLSTTYASNSAIRVTGFYGQSGTANITVSNGSVASKPFAVQMGVPNAQVSAAAARRFLEQAAFGPTPADATHVQTIGFQAWLTEQFNMPPVSTYTGITSSQSRHAEPFSNHGRLESRSVAAAGGVCAQPDLRHFARQADLERKLILFQNLLLSDAFANYRQIMSDVTLSPAMGQYLDMANNAQADRTSGSVANENYARELMQLFTIGTAMLNQDGSMQYDSNNVPIPTYSQFTVTEFARVYTGWTYAPAPGQPVVWNSYISSYGPLVAYAPEHDSGSKQLLNGSVSPAGITPQQDLNNALDNIFNHPNVGPFVGRQLIQHLVKSNPSPAYVARVAAAFASNSQGVRGDIQATIAAVLLDPEARANDNGGNDQPTDGHLQEPALFMAGMVRAFGGQMNDQNYYSSDLAAMGKTSSARPAYSITTRQTISRPPRR